MSWDLWIRMRKGLGGIESELDGLIRSKSEKIIVMADARQRWFDGSEAQRERGANVKLTLDEKIQYIAQRELAAAMEKTRGQAGSVIVMNPNNGEILALANWPKFNPNVATGVPAEARMNRSVSAVYEPGSTFKLITLAAAFDQGLVRADQIFDCENGSIVLSGHRIHDHKRFQLLTVSEILAKSSDVGAIKIAELAWAAAILRLHPGVWIWHADGRGYAGREPGNVEKAGVLERNFDRVGVDGTGSRCNAGAADFSSVRDREWRDLVQAPCGFGIAAQRQNPADGGNSGSC